MTTNCPLSPGLSVEPGERSIADAGTVPGSLSSSLHRTRLERIAERKVRRRQLTDDANVEISGRDLRERERRTPVGQIASSGLLDDGDATSCSPTRTSIYRSDQDRSSIGRTRQPPDQMTAWLAANCGANSWSMTPSGTYGVVNDSLAIYFLDAARARAFVDRWCIGCRIEV
jgi:hypothetical protein